MFIVWFANTDFQMNVDERSDWYQVTFYCFVGPVFFQLNFMLR